MANRFLVPIPEPTEEGKVLTVVNGEWQSAEPSSGASGLVVNVDYDESEATYTLDKNYTEIMSVVNNGVTPVFKMLSDTGAYRYFVFGGSGEVEYEGQTMYIVALYNPSKSSSDGLVVIQFVSDSATGTLVGGED